MTIDGHALGINHVDRNLHSLLFILSNKFIINHVVILGPLDCFYIAGQLSIGIKSIFFLFPTLQIDDDLICVVFFLFLVRQNEFLITWHESSCDLLTWQLGESNRQRFVIQCLIFSDGVVTRLSFQNGKDNPASFS